MLCRHSWRHCVARTIVSVLIPTETPARRKGLPAPSLDEKCCLCPWTHVLPLSPVYTPEFADPTSICRSRATTSFFSVASRSFFREVLAARDKIDAGSCSRKA